MSDLSREAVDAALLRTAIEKFARLTKLFLQGACVPEEEIMRAELAMSCARNAICKVSGGGGVAGAESPSAAGEVSPLPVFSDPLAEEEASKASAPKGPPDAVVIQLDQLRQRAAKLARHDNERKPQP